MKVFINPGHCPGVDSGAVNPNSGMQEADVALAIGQLVQKYLTDAGCEVQLLQSHESLEFRESMNNIFFAVIGGARPIAGELWIQGGGNRPFAQTIVI